MSFCPLDQLNFNNSYRTLPGHFWQDRRPEPLAQSYMVSVNPRVAKLLDINPCDIELEQLASYMSGQQPWPGAEPLAMKYAGHQFGQFNPELGDGRGLLLGEVLNSDNQRWDLHLKGAGTTAYSRFGDGRAVLRSSIREYLMSEAMFALGIASSRAMALLASTQTAQREVPEPCATLLRVTQCHIRFGHFEHFYYSNQHDDLKLLADYCIDRYYPSCKTNSKTESGSQTNPYLGMFSQILERSVLLAAQWQAYGFVHGVLNTDNMSILGETFDYGPYAFMDQWQWGFVANHSDTHGRYSYKNQPSIVHWNLAALAHALSPLVPEDDLKQELDQFQRKYQTHLFSLLRIRLGLSEEQTGEPEQDSDPLLLKDFLDLVCNNNLDANYLLRQLSEGKVIESKIVQDWLKRYQLRTQNSEHKDARLKAMKTVNPKYVLRNYIAEEAISDAYQGDFIKVNNILGLISQPFEEHKGFERYAETTPEAGQNIPLSCSS